VGNEYGEMTKKLICFPFGFGTYGIGKGRTLKLKKSESLKN
jgi:hypothetical protein